jgi:hypothetical protein
MDDSSIQSNSQSGSVNHVPGSNGVDKEAQVQSGSRGPNNGLFVEDFNQHHINRGQVKINLLLTTVNEKIRLALEQLESTVEKLANKQNVAPAELTAVKDAIAAVHTANQQVAGEFPPGCDPARVDRPPMTN